MTDILQIVLVFGGWIFLQTWLLPRLGVST